MISLLPASLRLILKKLTLLSKRLSLLSVMNLKTAVLFSSTLLMEILVVLFNILKVSPFLYVDTYTLFNLVSDCLDHPGAVALTQFFCGPQVVTGCLHLLLLKRHHGILQ